MIDWTNQYIEVDPSERAQYFWVSIFFYMAKTVIDDYGQAGESCIREAVRSFGRERGIRRRQRSDALGLPPSVSAMSQMVDIYSDPRFAIPPANGKKRLDVLEPEHRFMKVYACPNSDMWAILEGKKPGDPLKIGAIYCEEVHHHLYGDYDPAMQVNLTDILTKGDACCDFRLHLREANRNPFDAGRYKSQSWEDFGESMPASIYGMFCLHFYHYALAVYNAFGESELRKIIHAWGMERGVRLKELNRRNGVLNHIDILVRDGDLFLDPREDKEILELSADEGHIAVRRSIMCQLLRDHNAGFIAPIFFDEATRGVCDAYNSAISYEIRGLTTEGKGSYELILYK